MSSAPRHLAVDTTIYRYDPNPEKRDTLGVVENPACCDPNEQIHPTALRIKQACCNHFEANKRDCNKFVKAVVNGGNRMVADENRENQSEIHIPPGSIIRADTSRLRLIEKLFIEQFILQHL